MTLLKQPVEMQRKIEIHARELERKAETTRLEKLKARRDVAKNSQFEATGAEDLTERND